eukprot:gene6687-7776_t
MNIDQFFETLSAAEKKIAPANDQAALSFNNQQQKDNVRAVLTSSPTASVPQMTLVNDSSFSSFNVSSVPPYSIFPEMPDLMMEMRDKLIGVSLVESRSEDCMWPRNVSTESLAWTNLHMVSVSPATSTIELEVDQTHHQLSLSSYKEVALNTSLTSSNSTSLQRAWNENSGDFHRGDAASFPFLPGGIDSISASASPLPMSSATDRVDWSAFWNNPSSLLTKAPGMPSGADFGKQVIQTESTSLFEEDEEEEENEEEDEEEDEEEEDDEEEEEEEENEKEEVKEVVKEIEVLEIDNIIQDSDTMEKKAANVVGEEMEQEKEKEKKRQWAFNETGEITTPFAELIANPAIEYAFELDSFQKQAIVHMERGESVFISAHTSAGKTVIAEYAIAMAAKNMTRAIYTSPIKALSNQKFRDFKNTFGDVGLITGDVSVSPAASCLVLTTEILRSMLYKGADLIRDIEWVIFDEVHYLNDLERGVVWEEVIIMLPAHVKIVLLSATVSNPLEFADWIGRTKKMPIYVIGTLKRPVPLEHFLHTPSNELFKVVDSSRRFLMDGYNKAHAAVYKDGDTNRGPRGGAAKSGWTKLITMLKDKNMLPVIVFSFSKNKCQEYAFSLGSHLALTTTGERSQIKVFVEESLARLQPDDKQLPQILQMRDFLERGIGVHHGGLLPIVKELVEILFSRSLVKVLFATETFAMGVNMPAKTVVYSHTRKHDGISFRDLLPGEYTQMSGRAGRRGLDAVGTVILTTWKDMPESSDLESMILGVPSKLNSQFRLTYNMILNLLRVADFKVEDMIKRSFSEFATQRDIPDMQKAFAALTLQHAKIPDIECILGEPDIENYYGLFSECRSTNNDVQKAILSTQSDVHFQNGRVVVVSKGDEMSLKSYSIGTNNLVTRTFKLFALDLVDGTDELKSKGHSIYSTSGLEIKKLCDVKLKFDVKSIEEDDKVACNLLEQQLLRLIEEHPLPLGPPALDPITKMKLKSVEFGLKYDRLQTVEKLIPQSKCHGCPKLREHFTTTEARHEIATQLDQLKFSSSDENLALMPEFQTRLRILCELDYIDDEKTVLVKGKVSREVNTCEELIIPELIFENAFITLEPAEIVSVLSTLIFHEKNASEPALTPRLLEAKERLIQINERLSKLQILYGLEPPNDERSKILNFGLMEVTYEWARGMPFHEICKLTNVLEGTIVRAITRIGETCQEVRNCARIIGDTKLYQKMEEAIKLIKRDIVFASSLYVV